MNATDNALDKRIIVVLALIAFFVPVKDAGSQDAAAKERRSVTAPTQLWKTRPVRRDEPLREENISDIEVRQIEGVMKELYPGSIVYISAVTTGCPCQDGAGCDNQVWSVANLGNTSSGIALSRIDGKWQVGPLQQWWLVRDRLWNAYRKSRHSDEDSQWSNYQEFRKTMQKHYDVFPVCSVVLPEALQ